MEATPWRRKASSSSDLDRPSQRPLKPLLQIPPAPSLQEPAGRLKNAIGTTASPGAACGTLKLQGFPRPAPAGSENQEGQLKRAALLQRTKRDADSSKKQPGAQPAASRWSRFSVKAGLAASRSATLSSSQPPGDKPCALASSSQDKDKGPAAATPGDSAQLRAQGPHAAQHEVAQQGEGPLHDNQGVDQSRSQQQAQERTSGLPIGAEQHSSGNADPASDPGGSSASESVLAAAQTGLCLPIEELLEKVPWARPSAAEPSCEDSEFDLLSGGLDFDPCGAKSPAIVSMLALKPGPRCAVRSALGESGSAPRRSWRLPFAAPRVAPKAAEPASSVGTPGQDIAEPAPTRQIQATAAVLGSSGAGGKNDAPWLGIREPIASAAGVRSSLAGQQPRIRPTGQGPSVHFAGSTGAGAAAQRHDYSQRSRFPEARLAPAGDYYDFADRDEYPNEELDEDYDGAGPEDEPYTSPVPTPSRPAAVDWLARKEVDADASFRQPISDQHQGRVQESNPHRDSFCRQPGVDFSKRGRASQASRGDEEGLDLDDGLAGPSGRGVQAWEGSAFGSRTPGEATRHSCEQLDLGEEGQRQSSANTAARVPRSRLAAKRSTSRKPKRRLVKLYSEDAEEAGSGDDAAGRQKDLQSTQLEESAQQPAKPLKRLKRAKEADAAPTVTSSPETGPGSELHGGKLGRSRRLPVSFLADTATETARANPFVSSAHLQKKKARAATLPRAAAQVSGEPLDLGSALHDIDAQLKSGRLKRKAAAEPELIDLTGAEPLSHAPARHAHTSCQAGYESALQDLEASNDEGWEWSVGRGHSPLRGREDDWEDGGGRSENPSPFRAANTEYLPRANARGESSHAWASRSAWDEDPRPQERQLGSSRAAQGGAGASGGGAASGRPWWYRFPDFVPLAALAEGRNPRTGAIVYIDYGSQFQDAADAADTPGPSKRGRGAARKPRAAGPRKKAGRAPAKGRRGSWHGRRKT